MKFIFLKNSISSLLLHLFFTNFALAQTTFITTFGGNFHQIGAAVKQCLDGGYIIAGTYVMDENDANAYIVKTNAFGEMEWTRIFTGTKSDSTQVSPGMGAFDVIQLRDSTFLVSGWKHFNDPYMHLIKVDLQGNTIWTKEVCHYWAQAVQQTFDGGFICAGDGLTKTNADGEVTWCQENMLQGMYIIQTSDSNYVVSGSSYDDYTVLLQKINTTGTIRWTKYFPGQFNNTSNNILAETKEGGFLIVIPYDDNSILLKTNGDGEAEWLDTLRNVTGTSVVHTRDGGISIGGFNKDSCNLILIKTDPTGQEIWRRSYCSPKPNYYLYNSEIKSMHQTTDGGFILTGLCGSLDGDLEVILIKTDSMGFIHTTATASISSNRKTTVFPNPWTVSTIIHFKTQLKDAELSLINMLGEVIYYKGHVTGEQVEIMRDAIPAGIYFAVLRDKDNSSLSAKMIVVDP